MKDVVVGKGNFRGKGVFANRDFKKDEIVVPYNLKEISREDFINLPKNEQAFVHSFWGKAFLFHGESRYVNHALSPSTYQDLDRKADIALRDIKKGEAITTDGGKEIYNELTTFLETYEQAANSRDFDKVAPLIADDAIFEFTNGTFKGKTTIQKAFEDTWDKIQKETYTIAQVEWNQAAYLSAMCVYKFKSNGLVDGKRQLYEGKGMNELKRIDGNWQIIHERLIKI